jgi:protein required for attachment to host cells
MRYCVVVANGSHARFFSLETPQFPELESGPHLHERKSLSDPELKERGQNLWSGRPGKNRTRAYSGTHDYDDHRERHAAEYERRFVQLVAEEAAHFTRAQRADQVILVGVQRQLPQLRTAFEQQAQNARVKELAKDLSKLAPQALHDHLTKEGLLPPRRTGDASS